MEKEIKELIKIINKAKRVFSLRLIIIVGIVILLLIGVYFAYAQIKSYQSRQLEKEKQAQELTSEEIETISKSIVKLECYYDENDDGERDYEVYGSGIYISKNSIYEDETTEEEFNYYNGYVLTNGHVAQLKRITKEGYNYNYCYIFFDEGQTTFNSNLGTYAYNEKTHFLEEDLDIALLKYQDIINNKTARRSSIPNVVLGSFLLKNYHICPSTEVIGEKVYIFGYPSSAFEYSTAEPGEPFEWERVDDSWHPRIRLINEPTLLRRNLIVFDGIISGVDSNGDFYTTAKIDSGVSGGLAVSKIDNEICIVGIPTWISGGDYENLGVIQSFQKIKNALMTSPIDVPGVFIPEIDL